MKEFEIESNDLRLGFRIQNMREKIKRRERIKRIGLGVDMVMRI